jgi:hypothetical protein
MIPTELPNAFVWTTIAADAGQPRSILNRKELERRARSTFWGVLLLDWTRRELVNFSPPTRGR